MVVPARQRKENRAKEYLDESASPEDNDFFSTLYADVQGALEYYDPNRPSSMSFISLKIQGYLNAKMAGVSDFLLSTAAKSTGPCSGELVKLGVDATLITVGTTKAIDGGKGNMAPGVNKIEKLFKDFTKGMKAREVEVEQSLTLYSDFLRARGPLYLSAEKKSEVLLDHILKFENLLTRDESPLLALPSLPVGPVALVPDARRARVRALQAAKQAPAQAPLQALGAHIPVQAVVAPVPVQPVAPMPVQAQVQAPVAPVPLQAAVAPVVLQAPVALQGPVAPVVLQATVAPVVPQAPVAPQVPAQIPIPLANGAAAPVVGVAPRAVQRQMALIAQRAPRLGVRPPVSPRPVARPDSLRPAARLVARRISSARRDDSDNEDMANDDDQRADGEEGGAEELEQARGIGSVFNRIFNRNAKNARPTWHMYQSQQVMLDMDKNNDTKPAPGTVRFLELRQLTGLRNELLIQLIDEVHAARTKVPDNSANRVPVPAPVQLTQPPLKRVANALKRGIDVVTGHGNADSKKQKVDIVPAGRPVPSRNRKRSTDNEDEATGTKKRKADSQDDHSKKQ